MSFIPFGQWFTLRISDNLFFFNNAVRPLIGAHDKLDWNGIIT